MFKSDKYTLLNVSLWGGGARGMLAGDLVVGQGQFGPVTKGIALPLVPMFYCADQNHGKAIRAKLEATPLKKGSDLEITVAESFYQQWNGKQGNASFEYDTIGVFVVDFTVVREGSGEEQPFKPYEKKKSEGSEAPAKPASHEDKRKAIPTDETCAR